MPAERKTRRLDTAAATAAESTEPRLNLREAQPVRASTERPPSEAAVSSESESNPRQSGAVSASTDRPASASAEPAGAEPAMRQVATIRRFSAAPNWKRDPPDAVQLAAQSPGTADR